MSEEIILQNNYKPTDKFQMVHASTARFIVLVGGMGSGKSRGVIQELEQSCLQWSGMPCAVYRKTMPALRDSTLHEYKAHLTPGVSNYLAREDKSQFHNGSFVNFRGLDDPNKAKSSEYAFLILEEADEFTHEDFKFLNGRIRKKGPWPLRIILVLNPCDESHWIYKEFVENSAAYESAGGLLVLHLSTYDNIENLPEGYVQQNTVGMTPDEIERYVWGRWGSIARGEPVYKKYCNSALHIEKWNIYPGQILYRGWDFGFNRPACSFRLVDQFARKNARYSMLGDKIELDLFAKQVLHETEAQFPDCVVRDFCDPRGHDRHAAVSSRQASTSIEILRDCGIHALGERGSREYVEPGIKEIKRELSTLIAGKPELTIDPSNTLLIQAYINGRYVRDDDGHPKKDGFYEHICDADRYIPHNAKMVNAVKEAMKARGERQTQTRPRNRFTGYR